MTIKEAQEAVDRWIKEYGVRYFSELTNRYVDNHRKQLKKAWPSFAEFKEKYEVPQDLIDTILKNGEKQNIKPKDQAELEKTLPPKARCQIVSTRL